jgi:hypothetical protein
MGDQFVGTMVGQDEQQRVTITLRAGTPPPPPPITTGPPSVGILANTITVDGVKGQITVGGASQTGQVSVLNPLGRLVGVLEASTNALRLYRVLGAMTVEVQNDPDGILTLFTSEAKPTITLNAKTGSGRFGGSGVDGDVLVFAAGAKSNAAADAAVWIKGSTGDVVLQNADCAEDFDVEDSPAVEPGAVLSLGDGGPLTLSRVAYDRKVAGVISGAGGQRPGIVLGRTPGANRWPIALSGRAFCKVDAGEGAVAVGDLLTTAPRAGHAMAARDREKAFGAVIGKALAPLASGTGLVPVLIALQ